MTSALVVVESVFGNSRAVADAVAAGLAQVVPTVVVDVDDAPTGVTADLLVVGGPTHAFGMSRPSTREAARSSRGPGPGLRTGIREWTSGLGRQDGLAVATFDTRIRKRGVPGSAARSALHRLRRLGLRPLDGPQSFWVAGTEGPLLPGEVERARQWGRQLADRLLSDRPTDHATRS
jgi:hypothetical protein